MTLLTPFFEKLLRVMSGLSLRTCMSNLKSVALEELSTDLIEQSTACRHTDTHSLLC